MPEIPFKGAMKRNATGRWPRRKITSFVGAWLPLAAALMSTHSTVGAQETRWPGCAQAGLASFVVPTAPSDPPENQVYSPLRGFDREVDLGIGHLYPVDYFDWDWTMSLTLPLFERALAPPATWLVNGWVVPAAGPPRPLGVTGLTETGYEIASFIVFEVRSDGRVRLRFAPGDSGIAWTHSCFFDQASGRVAVERWETRLLSQEISPLHFRAQVRHALRRSPTETSQRLRWIPAEHTYVLRPFEVRGDWMRVELSQPSDYCTGPDDPPVDKVEGWSTLARRVGQTLGLVLHARVLTLAGGRHPEPSTGPQTMVRPALRALTSALRAEEPHLEMVA